MCEEVHADLLQSLPPKVVQRLQQAALHKQKVFPVSLGRDGLLGLPPMVLAREKRNCPTAMAQEKKVWEVSWRLDRVGSFSHLAFFCFTAAGKKHSDQALGAYGNGE